MTTRLIVYLLFTPFVLSFVESDEQPTRLEQEILQPAETNGLIGVASVAGIASRNGRVSTLGGIQFYPGLDSPITLTNTDGGSYFYPLTITKEGDGKFASGSIQLVSGHPGSVVVSSTSRSGYGSDFKVPFNVNNINQQLLKDFFIQPLPELFEKPRTLDPEPWLLKDVFHYTPPRPSVADGGWFYPNFNPFMNFWR